MQNIINVLATVIVSMGGMGVIVLGLSRFIGGIIAGKIEAKYKNELDKSFEEYRSKINERLNKLDKIEEKALYISKYNYENEYKIYMEIWPLLNKCVSNTIRLYPMGIENVPVDEQEREKYNEEKYEDFRESYNNFSICIDKYAPFYQESYYNDLNEIKNECYSIGSMFKMFEFDVKYNESYRGCRDLKMSGKEWKEVKEKEDKILKVKNELLVKIREYLNKLKLNDNV